MGDINITGKYRVNGVPITTGEVGQTPWHSNINADQHELQNLKRLRIVNTSDNYPIYFGTGSCARYIFYNHSGGGGEDRSDFLRWIQSRENGGSGNACNIGFADNDGTERLYLRHDGISVADGGMYIHGDIDVSGNYKQAGTVREFPPTHTSSNNNQVLTIYNNKMEWRTPAGESQTPWLHNIDAANHTLTNLASLNGHSIIFVPPYSSSNNNQVLTVVSGQLQWHTSSASQWLSAAGGGIYYPNRVGIYCTDPAYPLDVGGRIHIRHDLTVGASDATAGIWYDSQTLVRAAFLGFATNGTDFRLWSTISSGNVLVFNLSNNRTAINKATANYIMDINGDCNLDAGYVYRVGGVPLRIPPPLTTNDYVLTIVNGQMEWRPPSGGGSGFNLKGFVDKHQNLPNSGNAIGDAYVTENSGELWVWDGDNWFNAGKFVPEIDIREHQTPWLTDIDADDHNLVNVGEFNAESIYQDGKKIPDPDHILLSTGSYSNPNWLTSLAWSKITGAPAIPASLWAQWGAGIIYTNDKVGVNTNSVSYQFEVAGRMKLKPYSGATAGIWFDAMARVDAFFLGENNGDFRLYSAYSAANVLYFTGATNRAGFNMAAPQYTVDVNGDCNVSGVYRIAGAAKSFPPTPTTGNNGDVLSVNNVGAMVWTPPVVQTPWLSNIDAGRFSISNLGSTTWTSPNGSYTADVSINNSGSFNANFSNVSINITVGNFVIYPSQGFYLQSSNTSGNATFRVRSQLISADLFRVDLTSGNTGFGTNNPAYRVDVAGDVNITGKYRINGLTSDYSTTERDTGLKWTDGNSIFQKTITSFFETLFDFYDVAHGVLPAIVLLVDFNAVFYNNLGHQYVIPYVGSNGAGISASLQYQNLRFYCSGEHFLRMQVGENGQIFITIRYTKQ